jgi:hypothetical protein
MGVYCTHVSAGQVLPCCHTVHLWLFPLLSLGTMDVRPVCHFRTLLSRVTSHRRPNCILALAEVSSWGLCTHILAQNYGIYLCRWAVTQEMWIHNFHKQLHFIHFQLQHQPWSFLQYLVYLPSLLWQTFQTIFMHKISRIWNKQKYLLLSTNGRSI